MTKKNNVLKKNKYYILLFVILALLIYLIIGLIVVQVKRRAINQYNDEIVIVKSSSSEIGSFSLKELRKMSPDKFKKKFDNDSKTLELEGVSLEKLLYKLNFDVQEKTIIEVEDKNGNKSKVSLDAALEPSRVYLIYAINNKPLMDYKNKLGTFMLVDKTSNKEDDRILNIESLNIN